MGTTTTPTAEDILNEFTAAYEQPTPEAVAKWCRRFPEHAEAIIDYASTWFRQSCHAALHPPQPIDPDVWSAAVQRAMDRFHAKWAEREAGRSKPGA